MTVFEWLIVSHLVGDWLLQTEWQARNKASSWAAMLTHVAIYHLVVFGVLGALFGFSNPRVYVVIVFLAATHTILDRQWPVAWIIKALRISVDRTPERWLSVAVDQSLHVVLLTIVTVYLTAA